jgi:hypothetical protein
MGARWYDPTQGAFITSDPAQAGTNWYAYASGNPVANADPSGLKDPPKVLVQEAKQWANSYYTTHATSTTTISLGDFVAAATAAATGWKTYNDFLNWAGHTLWYSTNTDNDPCSGGAPATCGQDPNGRGHQRPNPGTGTGTGPAPTPDPGNTTPGGHTPGSSTPGGGGPIVRPPAPKPLPGPIVDPNHGTGVVTAGTGSTTVVPSGSNPTSTQPTNDPGIDQPGVDIPTAGTITGPRLVSTDRDTYCFEMTPGATAECYTLEDLIRGGRIDLLRLLGYSHGVGGAGQGGSAADATNLGFSGPADAAEGNGADNPNAADALTRKLNALQNVQQGSASNRVLPDGRVRYYGPEVAARTPGRTRGASYVTEWDPSNGFVRSWMENYDAAGNVIRVHPKMLNGQILDSPHIPPLPGEC